MIEDRELSKMCFYFEMFMEKANGKYEAYSPGFYASMIKNLIVAEKGQIVSMETVTRYEKQLVEIKEHIEEAIDNYMAKSGTPSDMVTELKRCKEQVVWAVSTEELMNIVYYTIDLTVDIRIEMKY